jgi:hypothetical protein
VSVRVLSWVFDHATVRGAAWQVLVVLADTCDEEGANAYPSRQRIALRTNLTEKAVREAWALLEREGWIEHDGWSPRGTRQWRIVMSKVTPRKAMRGERPPVPTVPPGTNGIAGNTESPGAPEVPAPGTDGAQGGNPRSPEPSIQPPREPSKRREEPIGFDEWAGYHSTKSGRTVPRAGTATRANLARAFAAILAEGHTLEDFKLATDGVVADAWKREHGHDKFDTVLRKTKFAELVEDGRRAGAPRVNGHNGRALTYAGDPGRFDSDGAR